MFQLLIFCLVCSNFSPVLNQQQQPILAKPTEVSDDDLDMCNVVPELWNHLEVELLESYELNCFDENLAVIHDEKQVFRRTGRIVNTEGSKRNAIPPSSYSSSWGDQTSYQGSVQVSRGDEEDEYYYEAEYYYDDGEEGYGLFDFILDFLD